MSSISLDHSSGGERIVICSALGVQEITIDPATGQPQEPAIGGNGCDWCQSFGLIADTMAPVETGWVVLARSFTHELPLTSPLRKPLRLVGDYNSRAPPIL